MSVIVYPLVWILSCRLFSRADRVVTLPCVGSNNMLYPREDKEHKMLKFTCRQCGHEEDIKAKTAHTPRLLLSVAVVWRAVLCLCVSL